MNCVVCVFPPLVAVTVILKEPLGVEYEVLMVKVLAKVGPLDWGLKLHDAPTGRPLHDKLTGCVVPLVK